MAEKKLFSESWPGLLKDYALVTLGVVSYALGWSVFLLPNNLVGGGVSGFASILMYATDIPMGITYFVLNVLPPSSVQRFWVQDSVARLYMP